MKNSTYQYKSPFQFLDPYTEGDYSKYFGRDKEIKEIFQLFKKTNVVIIYGPSGSGKTSLARCGLTNKYHEWKSVVIRRNNGIIESYFDQLKDLFGPQPEIQTIKGLFDEILRLQFLENKDEQSGLKQDKLFLELENLVDSLYSQISFTPFFIFDQFEELFLYGSKSELRDFSYLLSLITSRIYFSNTVICVQEEFFSNIPRLENFNPDILDFKYHIGIPKEETVKEVVLKSFKTFNVNQHYVRNENNDEVRQNELTEDEKNNVVDVILNKIITKDGKYHFPFLQIYLDKVYKEDFKNTYGNEEFENLKSTKDQDYFLKHPIELELDEIEKYGNIEEIMSNYIYDVNNALIEKENGIDAKNNSELVITLLKKFFISDNNTIKAIALNRNQSTHKISSLTYDSEENILNKVLEHIWPFETGKYSKHLKDIFEELISARILKTRTENDKKYLELSHNLLARVVGLAKVKGDVQEYYSKLFNIHFTEYKNEQNISRKRKLLLTKELFYEIKNDYINIINSDSDTEKENYWLESEKFHKKQKQKRKLFNWLAIFLSLTLIGMLIGNKIQKDFYHSKLNKQTKQLQDNVDELKEERDKLSVTDKLASKVYKYLGQDRTKAFWALRAIETESNNPNTLDSLELYVNLKNDLELNYINHPLYKKKISITNNKSKNHIINFKSRLSKSQDSLFLFANSKTEIYFKSVSLSNLDTVTSGSLKNLDNMTSFEPFTLKSKKQIMYATSKGLFLTSYHCDKPTLLTNKDGVVHKSVKYLEQVEQSSFFVGLLANKQELIRIELIDSRNGKARFLPFKILNHLKAELSDSLAKIDNYKIKKIKTFKDKVYCLAEYEYEVNNKVKDNFKKKTSSLIISIPIKNNFIKDTENRIFKSRLFSQKVRLDSILQNITDFKIDDTGELVLLENNHQIIRLNENNNPKNIDISNSKYSLNRLKHHHISKINSIDFYTPQTGGQYALIGSADATASLYFDKDIKTEGNEGMSKVFEGHEEAVVNVSFINYKEDKLLALTCSENGEVFFWDLSNSFKKTHVIKEAIEPIKLRYDRSKKRLLVGYRSGVEYNDCVGSILELHANLDIKRKLEIGNENHRYLTSVDLFNDGGLIVGSYYDQHVFRTNPEITKMEDNGLNLKSMVTDLRYKNNTLAIATHRGLYIYDLKKTPILKQDKVHKIDSINFNAVDIYSNSNKHLVIAAAEDGNIYAWSDPVNNKKSIKLEEGHSDKVTSLAFSNDGSFFVSGSSDNKVIVWYKKNKNDKQSIKSKKLEYKPKIYEELMFNSDVESVDLSANNILAIGKADKTVSLFDMTINDDGVPKPTIRLRPIVHEFEINDLEFGKENELYVVDKQGVIKLWDITTKSFKDDFNKKLNPNK